MLEFFIEKLSNVIDFLAVGAGVATFFWVFGFWMDHSKKPASPPTPPQPERYDGAAQEEVEAILKQVAAMRYSQGWTPTYVEQLSFKAETLLNKLREGPPSA